MVIESMLKTDKQTAKSMNNIIFHLKSLEFSEIYEVGKFIFVQINFIARILKAEIVHKYCVLYVNDD